MSSSGRHRQTDSRPTVVVCATGGTIAGSPDNDGQLSPTLTLEALVASAPGLKDAARLKLVQLRQVPSVELGLGDVIEMITRFRAEPDASGFVVIQGTDTIEESAYAFDLLWERPAPIVVTGAMRPTGAAGSDGPPNLIASILVAGSDKARGSGAFVVLNQTIHAARFAAKVHATRPDAFESPLRGPVGEVAEGRVTMWADARREETLSLPEGLEPVPVALRRIGIGDDGRDLKHLLEAGYRGLVVEAMGTGHVPASLVGDLAGLAEAIPVLLASRTGPGALYRNTYGFPGSETDLLGRGVISASGLDGIKARVKLTLLLMGGADLEEIRRSFAAEPQGKGSPDMDRHELA